MLNFLTVNTSAVKGEVPPLHWQFAKSVRNAIGI